MDLEADVDNALMELMQPGPKPLRVKSEHLPVYPSAKEFPTVHVPRMPRLSQDLGSDAKLMVRAYKAVCLHKYGKKPRVERKAVFRMQSAAQALYTAGVKSPYAWAAFRLTQWMFSERKDKPPGIDYVFSKKVVDAHADHYSRKAASLDVTNRITLTPTHLRLLELWESCRRAAQRPIPGVSGEIVTRKAVARILPAELYSERAAKIPGERAAIEADMFRRLAAGEWIW